MSGTGIQSVLCNCPMQVILCSVPQPPLSGRDLKGFCSGRRGFSLRLLPNPLLQLNTIFLPNPLLQLNTTLMPNLMQLRAALPCPLQVNTIRVIGHCCYNKLKVRAVSDRITWNSPELGSMPSFLYPVLPSSFLCPVLPSSCCCASLTPAQAILIQCCCRRESLGRPTSHQALQLASLTLSRGKPCSIKQPTWDKLLTYGSQSCTTYMPFDPSD